MPTAATLPLLILIAILWKITRGQILAIVVFTSIFTAASAINFGGLGIAPWLFTLALCLAIQLVLHGHRRLRVAQNINKASVRLLLIFVLYATATAALWPLLFHGVPVDHDTTAGPLNWSVSNLAQACYLLTACLLYFMTVTGPRQQLRVVMEWYIRGAVAASLLGMWQLANAVAHVPYPDAVLYSNPSYMIYHAYQINGIWRLNGPCCEASEYSGILAVGLALLGWELATTRIRPWRLTAFLLMLATMLMTLSSVGYLTLILMTLLGGVLYAGWLLRRGAPSHGRLIAAILVAGAAITFCIASERGVETVTHVFTSTLIDKSTTDSYRIRVFTQEAAMRVCRDTNYMGAGWGSIRASGLGYVLLGTVGVPGLLLFLLFVLSLFPPLLSRRRPSEEISLGRQAMFAASLLLTSMFIAGAEPVTPIFWVLLGVASTVAPARHALTRTHQTQRAKLYQGEEAIPWNMY